MLGCESIVNREDGTTCATSQSTCNTVVHVRITNNPSAAVYPYQRVWLVAEGAVQTSLDPLSINLRDGRNGFRGTADYHRMVTHLLPHYWNVPFPHRAPSGNLGEIVLD